LYDVCVSWKVRFDDKAIQKSIMYQELIRAIREARNKNGLGMKESLELKVFKSDESNEWISDTDAVQFISKFANLSSIGQVTEELSGGASFISGASKYFLLFDKKIDMEAERNRLETELKYAQGFVDSIKKKLDNEKFVQNAKAEVIENEKKKLTDGIERLNGIESSLKGLG